MESCTVTPTACVYASKLHSRCHVAMFTDSWQLMQQRDAISVTEYTPQIHLKYTPNEHTAKKLPKTPKIYSAYTPNAHKMY